MSLGDEVAFGQLFKHYFNHLYGFALSVTKSDVLAEEIVQDVFVNTWNRRQELVRIEKFDGWLFILTRNQAYKVIRQQVQKPVFLEHIESFFVLSQDNADQELLYKESRDLLRRAAATLPPQQQLIFEMSRLEEFSLDEIAGRLQLSKNTVKVHLSKALGGIRHYLQEHPHNIILLYCLFRYLYPVFF